MFRSKKTRKRPLQISRRLESLERRELMAGDFGMPLPAQANWDVPAQIGYLQQPSLQNSSNLDGSSSSQTPLVELLETNDGTVLHLVGRSTNDRVLVSDLGDEVRVRASSVIDGIRLEETYYLSQNDFDSIAFQGMNGDDYFYSSTSHPVLARGGEGNDRLFGGKGVNQLLGGAGDDTLRGGNADDSLDGGAGDDSMYGRGGDDILYGGTGNDSMFGEAGNDDMIGEGGESQDNHSEDNDYMNGGSGNDWISSGRGNDRVYGSHGNDTLLGGDGVDRLYGDSGRDELHGGDEQDFLYGGTGNDKLHGEAGNDFLYGNSGNDTLKGGHGDDYLFGQAGNDRLMGQAGLDRLYGGADNDRLDGGHDGITDRLLGGSGSDVFVRHKEVWGSDDPDWFLDIGNDDDVDNDWHW